MIFVAIVGAVTMAVIFAAGLFYLYNRFVKKENGNGKD